MIAIVAILGDAEHWTEVALFGRSKEANFRRFLELPNGIPSHDTFNRVFNRLDPAQLNRCFMRWVQHLAEGLGVQAVAIDGKTLRRSGDPAGGHPPLHLISAWAHEARLVLGQIACEAKSNEITAVPELIAMLELEGCLVTVDALNTQRETAEAILKGEGDYVMALKSNQPTLHDDAVLMLAEADDAPTQFALDEHMAPKTPATAASTDVGIPRSRLIDAPGVSPARAGRGSRRLAAWSGSGPIGPRASGRRRPPITC